MSGLNELRELAEQLGPDELAVLVEVARGLVLGRDQYGELDLERDQRDFLAEAAGEDRDGLTYLSAELVRRTRAATRLRRIRRDGGFT